MDGLQVSVRVHGVSGTFDCGVVKHRSARRLTFTFSPELFNRAVLSWDGVKRAEVLVSAATQEGGHGDCEVVPGLTLCLLPTVGRVELRRCQLSVKDSMMCLTVNDIIRLRADSPIVLGNPSVANVREWALDAVESSALQPTAAKRQRR